MNQNPLVTIITPSFNQAEFLENTILSVLKQDYQPLEYYIIDGGSTDGSLEIIRKYENDLSGWISEPDSGQAEAINKGLLRANGEYVAWLNSDDLYLPEAVGHAVQLFNKHPDAGMVFANAITIDQQGQLIGILEFDDWSLQNLLGFRIICQPAVFMKRRVLEEAGFLDPDYHFMLDHNLWIRMAIKAGIQYAGKSSAKTDYPDKTWAAARHHDYAKNVSKPEQFAMETLALKSSLEVNPDLESLVSRDRKMIEAGAHRLIARYLLDAGQPLDSLKNYWVAFQNDPKYALVHSHRIVFAFASLLGLDRFVNRDSLRRNPTIEQRDQLAYLEAWCGLRIQNGAD